MPINPILDALKDRDIDVLRVASTGKTQIEIAETLTLAAKSVNNRVADLKLLHGEHSTGGL